MKLLLTSTGLSHKDIKFKLLEIVGNNAKNITVGFVTTAARTPDELIYTEKSRAELIEFGISQENIINFDFGTKNNKVQLPDFDILYVCGGNTFHLLNEIKRNNYTSLLQGFISDNKLYVGVSAGSIICSPNIGVATVEPADDNDVGLKDFSGLNVIDFEVSPHTPNMVSFDSVEKYAKEFKRKIWAFSDYSALFYDNKPIIIGERTEKFYDFSK